MGRTPCCSEEGLKKGPWTPEEDKLLTDYVEKNGHGSWRHLPKLAGLNRCGKSCRLRWTNYLRPDIKRGKFEEDEEQLIIHLHSMLGNKWSMIATHLPGRTDNEIKNYWNTHLRKKLLGMGIDPVTHRPRTDLIPLAASLPNLLAAATAANLGNLPSYLDSLKLQADAARLQLLQTLAQLLCLPSTSTSTAAAFDPMSLFSSAPLHQNYQLNDLLQLRNQLLGLSQNFMPNLMSTTPQLSNNNTSHLPISPNLECIHEEALMDNNNNNNADNNINYTTNTSNEDDNYNNHNSFPDPSLPDPSLVSSSTENTGFINSSGGGGDMSVISSPSTSTAPFEAWEELKLEDLGSEVGWKEILEQVSCWSRH